jgi:pimeloyl-ACP methyl ester carboxylesterase
MREVMIDSGTVPIAARDYGGPRPPLLLVHGAGGNLATMATLAQALGSAHRVVTVDLRGHGRSGDGPWDWDAVLDDVAAVADGLKLVRPAVVGMSLGGMVAALWARRRPDCPGAVSLDGNPPPSRPEHLAGMDPTMAAMELGRLRETFAAMTAEMAAPMTGEQVAAALVGQRAMAQRYGAPEDIWIEGFERNLVHDGGQTRLRPRPDITEQIRLALESFDLVTVYREARCPLLAVLATEDLPEQRPFHDLYEAHRRYIVERVDVARDNPLVRVIRLEGASHAMVAEQPRQLAALIASHLAADRR